MPHIAYVNTDVFLHVNISYDICLILPRVYPTKVLDLFLISPGVREVREVTLKMDLFML